jgi:hypothetical protein
LEKISANASEHNATPGGDFVATAGGVVLRGHAGKFEQGLGMSPSVMRREPL